VAVAHAAAVGYLEEAVFRPNRTYGDGLEEDVVSGVTWHYDRTIITVHGLYMLTF
jgi:hypothetical protein